VEASCGGMTKFGSGEVLLITCSPTITLTNTECKYRWRGRSPAATTACGKQTDE
jgi:hypothetical protein